MCIVWDISNSHPYPFFVKKYLGMQGEEASVLWSLQRNSKKRKLWKKEREEKMEWLLPAHISAEEPGDHVSGYFVT